MTKKKRTFTPEYKAEVVGLVRNGEQSLSAVARDLGLSESALRRWVLQSETDAGRGDANALTTPQSNHAHPIAPNILEREFTVAQPSVAWVGDITDV